MRPAAMAYPLTEEHVTRIESVAVVGAGFMGTGIAESVAAHGFPVRLFDADERQLSSAHQRIAASLDRAVAGGKPTAQARNEALDRIEAMPELPGVGGVDLVVEAVPEDRGLKLEVMTEIEQAVDDHTLVASNTSSIPIAELASVFARRGRVLGLGRNQDGDFASTNRCLRASNRCNRWLRGS